jgi:predicted PurR-regulated permease PerM
MSESRAPVAYRAVVLAGVLLVLGLLFRQLATLLLAVLMTVIISIPLSAGATRLERRGVPRAIGALATLMAGLAVIAGVLAFIIPTFVDETNHFVDDVPRIVDNLEKTAGNVTGDRPGEVGDKVQSFLRRYTDKPERLIGPITSIGFSVAGVFAAIVLILITAYYIAVRPEPLVNGALRLVPPSRRDQARHIMERLRSAWVGWMQGVVVHMFLSGTLLYIGLSVIGLDFAIVFAVLTALLVVVPYLGVIVGAVPPVLFALTDSPGKALLVLAVYVGVHEVEANLVIPMVMARAVKLHPALIAVGVVVVGELFGVVGLVVAVPIIASIVILTEELWVKEVESAYARRTAEALKVPEPGVTISETLEPPPLGERAEATGPTSRT